MKVVISPVFLYSVYTLPVCHVCPFVFHSHTIRVIFVISDLCSHIYPSSRSILLISVIISLSCYF
ncbi:uncharacterized protein NEPG_02558 [Nematocida parisii ERTm1]|nr:uncharacterized protein NEPG_02558 [Nematocida parisii ERTm1]EIJ92544.1 hypothetical protein NEPG_02558 [Nematocida parisii ERTm1]|eukprot:XP_013060385.1 hypothetical protein NEPG_02558 [Nematocida parisii ERTm1]